MEFSIILPTYNSCKSLAATLDSVLGQTCSDYEVVVVDGGSTDGTLEILKDYEKKFAGRLRWASEPDKGIYDAMNKGIGLAKGKWVYFLGSDDVFYSKNILKKVAEIVENSHLDVVYGNVKWGNTSKIYDGKFSVLKLMQRNICHQAIFYKRELFDRIGQYNLRYKILADYELNMRWFNDESVRHKYVDLVIVKYGVDGLSSSNSKDENFYKDREKIIEKYFPEEYLVLYKQLLPLREATEQNQELNLMKASKFWKMREYYLRFKSLFSSKNQS